MLLCALIVFVLSAVLAAQNAREFYQRGLVQEHSRGNLQEAIVLYAEALKRAGGDRALAASVLSRIAASHEKLGQQAEAAAAYAGLVREYPEQRTEVASAQERLTALRRSLPPGTIRSEANSRDVSSVVAPLFAGYCVACHDARSRAGGLDLGGLETNDVARNTALWETVARRLQARRDPPAGARRPDEGTYRLAVARIEGALDAAYAANSRPSQPAERVTDVELASRIARLIWNDAPDAALLADARSGKLRDPAVVERHVRRMVRDARSSALVSGFFADWLALGRVAKAQPDPTLFPRVDADLLQAMVTETKLFLESQLREDRDAADVWTANYTFVNERLARHYGLSNVTGSEFRRVVWPDATRAGILGQAGILTGLSFATRTSPTVRGSYVLARFLGVDAPEPPANVPALVESAPAAGTTMRERLIGHKANPSCTGCHAMFDPLGFALEHFDATGAWRALDGGAPIDASGTFIDGTRFNGPEELRAGLLKYRDAYYAGVTRRLMAYALNRTGKAGRVYDYEMATVRTVVRDASSSGYRWSSILGGIIASAPFQMKNVVP